MAKNEKIFLGGSYTSDQESRKQIALYGRRIEKIIIECNYIPSLNLLTNEKIFDKVDSPDGIFFENGEHFLKVGERILSKVSKKEIESIKGLRDCESDDYFMVSMMACNISMSEIHTSVAGIYETSKQSQGSYYEISYMLNVKKVPVLCLSHNDFGRKFGKMLIGQKTRLLRCVRYNDENLDEIVREFLTTDVKEKNLAQLSYRLPAGYYNKLKIVAKEKGFKNVSDLVRNITERYLEES